MKNLTRAGLLASAIAISTLGSASLHSSTDPVESKLYLLKVSNVMEAAELVESVGGSVFETAASLRYLGVTLTQDQLQLLSRSDLIVRIDDHQTASADDFASSISDEVAGLWWYRCGACKRRA